MIWQKNNNQNLNQSLINMNIQIEDLLTQLKTNLKQQKHHQLIDKINNKIVCFLQIYNHEKIQMQQYTQILQKELMLRNAKINELKNRSNISQGSFIKDELSQDYQQINESICNQQSMVIQKFQNMKYKLSPSIGINNIIKWFERSHQIKDNLIKTLYKQIVKKQQQEANFMDMLQKIKEQFTQRQHNFNKQTQKNQQLNNYITELVAELTRKEIQLSSEKVKYSNKMEQSFSQLQYKQQNSILVENSTFRSIMWKPEQIQYRKIDKQLNKHLDLLNLLKSDINFTSNFTFTPKKKDAPFKIKQIKDIVEYLNIANSELQLILSVLMQIMSKQSRFYVFNKSCQNYIKFKHRIQNLINGIDNMVSNERLNNTIHQHASLELIEKVFIQVRQIQVLISQQYQTKQQLPMNENIVETLNKILKSNQNKVQNPMHFEDNEKKLLQDKISNLDKQLQKLKKKIQQKDDQIRFLKSNIEQKQNGCIILAKQNTELRNRQQKNQKIEQELAKKQKIIQVLQKNIRDLFEEKELIISEYERTKNKFINQKALLLGKVQKTTEKLQFIEKLASQKFQSQFQKNKENIKPNANKRKPV